MNNLPLILLGGLGAVFFLSKKKSNSNSTVKLLLTTKFPGYEIKNDKFLISNKNKAIEYAQNTGMQRMKILIDNSKQNAVESNYEILKYQGVLGWLNYPLYDLFGLKTSDWDTKDLYKSKYTTHTDFIGPKLIESKFSKLFANNSEVMTELYLNYIAAAQSQYMSEVNNEYNFYKGNATKLITSWNDFLKKNNFNKYAITLEDLTELIKNLK
jgi:hypothetical protein